MERTKGRNMGTGALLLTGLILVSAGSLPVGATQIELVGPHAGGYAGSSDAGETGGYAGSSAGGEAWENGDGYEDDDLAGIFPENERDWCLILVNTTHPLPEDYVIPSFEELAGGNRVDSRIYPALQKMFDDAREVGCLPMITSSYRTFAEQQEIMDEYVQGYIASGYSREEAERLAGEWVAVPGTSEHQLGLAVDISTDNSVQDAGIVWYWLLQNSYRYGFIQRYPEEKADITGIQNEPWHYRYVGRQAALEMTQSGQCLEEYLGILD